MKEAEKELQSKARAERRHAAKTGEAQRLRQVRSAGAVPPACGPAIPFAPARGPVEMFVPVVFYPDGEDGYVARPAGFQNRSALRRKDIFAVMEAQAVRRRANQMPLSPGQVAMGRRYHDLVESHEAGLVKVQSFDDARGAGDSSVMDAYIAEGDEIALLRRRIGDGVALPVRRIRPTARGERRPVLVRTLVDMVCIRDLPVKAVMKHHGWGRDTGTEQRLLLELGEALDRMAGPVRSAVGVARFGQMVSIWSQYGDA